MHACRPPPGRQQALPRSRTTTASSVKNQAVAVLYHDAPLMEIIMAATTLTMPAGDAMPPLPILRRAPAALSSPSISAPPPAGHCDRRRRDRQRHGVVPAQPLRRRRHALPALPELARQSRTRWRRLSRIVHFEEVRRHAGTDAAHIYGGLLATLTAWCEQHGIAYQGVPVGTIKRFATGKGNADKAAMIAAIRARGFSPADDNEADALAILLWAIETGGGVR